MPRVTSIALPNDALLGKYLSYEGAFADCYTTSIDREITLEEFVKTFFDTWLFRLKRKILNITIGKPPTTQNIADLADGTSSSLAV